MSSTQVRRFWSKRDIETLRAIYPHISTRRVAEQLGRSVSAINGMAPKLGLRKTDEYLASPDACRLRRGDNVGKAHRYKPGHTPANKDVKGWDAGGRSHETRFKTGQRGNKWVPVGTERVNSDGYRDRKVADTGYPPVDWRPVHLLIWESHHGSMPPGHAVVFIDGDRTHVALENLVLLTRRELMARNTIARFPPALRHTIRLNRKLQRTIEERA